MAGNRHVIKPRHSHCLLRTVADCTHLARRAVGGVPTVSALVVVKGGIGEEGEEIGGERRLKRKRRDDAASIPTAGCSRMGLELCRDA